MTNSKRDEAIIKAMDNFARATYLSRIQSENKDAWEAFLNLQDLIRNKYHPFTPKPSLPKSLTKFETAKEIERQVALFFGIRTHVIVPNVSWGMFPYEADLIVLHKSNYIDEIEIKISRPDLLRDHKKYHQHDSHKVRRLWYAIPKKLEGSIPDIQERAGILVVEQNGIVKTHRNPAINKTAPKLTESEAFQLARLGAIRIWDLKYKIIQKQRMEENTINEMEIK